MDHTFELTNR